MRKATAYKRPLDEPVEWELRSNGRGVFHKIEFDCDVRTPAGVMKRVYIRNVCDLQDPSTDVAVLVGSIVEMLPASGVRKPQPAELWFWEDKFWTKAIDSQYGSGQDYYRDKKYLFYEVQVDRTDDLFKAIQLG